MLSSQQQTIRRILRVNHAGEHGAIAIYERQIRMSRHYPDLLPWLQETLGHEKQHRGRFRALMPNRLAKPCRAMAVWNTGGALLGLLTAAFGRFGVIVCTAAVERTVHRHLVEQIRYLADRDRELAETIRDIQREEDAHLAFAEANHDPQSIPARLLGAFVAIATEILILISTRGDSTKLRNQLGAAH
ncbi:MAG TPA: demethoxyubiquinone hydroxylase family protein [Terriglobales bacterium]|nr:demethoxyubiquinone hydroxylase family protein [Terriglobales bacterium]